MTRPPSDLRLNVYANWANRRQNLGSLIDQAKGFLGKVRGLHPLFGTNLHYVGGSRKQSPLLADDFSNLESIVLAKGWDREATRSLYTKLSDDEEVTRESMSRLGFRFAVGNLGRLDRDIVEFRFSDGSESSSRIGGFGMYLPLTAGEEFFDLDFLKALLSLIVDYWNPRYSGVDNAALLQAGSLPDREPYAIPIAWLNYCEDARVAEALPADIACERFGPRGVLFRLQDKAPRDDIDAAIQTALRVRDALLPGQWMSHAEDRSVLRG